MGVMKEFLELKETYNLSKAEFYELAEKVKNGSATTSKERLVDNYLEETENVSKAYDKYIYENLHVTLVTNEDHRVLIRVARKDYDNAYHYEIWEHDFKYCTLERRNGEKKYVISSHSFKNEEEVLAYSEELKAWLGIYSEIEKYMDDLNA